MLVREYQRGQKWGGWVLYSGIIRGQEVLRSKGGHIPYWHSMLISGGFPSGAGSLSEGRGMVPSFRRVRKLAEGGGERRAGGGVGPID